MSFIASKAKSLDTLHKGAPLITVGNTTSFLRLLDKGMPVTIFGGIAQLASITETFTATDTSTGVTAGGPAELSDSRTEAATATESSANTLSTSGVVTEAGTASESVAGTNSTTSSRTEAVTATESSTCSLLYAVDTVEVATASDSGSATVSQPVSVAESGSAADSSTSSLVFPATELEAGTASETSAVTMAAVGSITETGTATHTATTTAAMVAARTEAVTAAEEESAALSAVAAALEAGTATDESEAHYIFDVSTAETTGATEGSDATNELAVQGMVEAAEATEGCSCSVDYAISMDEFAAAAEQLGVTAQLIAALEESSPSFTICDAYRAAVLVKAKHLSVNFAEVVNHKRTWPSVAKHDSLFASPTVERSVRQWRSTLSRNANFGTVVSRSVVFTDD